MTWKCFLLDRELVEEGASTKKQSGMCFFVENTKVLVAEDHAEVIQGVATRSNQM
jgi:hypothetical protein